MSETKQEFVILNFWGKNAEKFSIPSPEGNNAVRIMTIHKSKGLEFPVVMPLQRKIIVKTKDKLWLEVKKWILVSKCL
jgi:ATP-dependent exoDNAse (exonuclease V) beta subunit